MSQIERKFDFVVVVRQGRRHVKHNVTSTGFASAAEYVLGLEGLPPSKLVRTLIVQHLVVQGRKAVLDDSFTWREAWDRKNHFESLHPDTSYCLHERHLTEDQFTTYINEMDSEIP